MTALTRRTFLALAALFTPLARLGVAAQAPAAAVSLDDFMRLSQRLTARTPLDRDLAATYLKALLADLGDATEVARIARNPGATATPAQVKLENTIIEWWYTGTYTIKGAPRLATHTGALMWSALGIRAPGTCAPTFGAWAQPPRSA